MWMHYVEDEMCYARLLMRYPEVLSRRLNSSVCLPASSQVPFSILKIIATIMDRATCAKQSSKQKHCLHYQMHNN
jgi:hypothetical protein